MGKQMQNQNVPTMSEHMKGDAANYELVNSAMNGVLCWQHKDTSWACDVRSETYWCS